MVKLFKSCSWIFPVALLILTLSCSNDLLGLFRSNDLDERLEEADNFLFLDRNGFRTLTLGDEYSFIVIADTHIENGNAGGLGELAGVINTDDKFVVILGDITQNGALEDVQKFIEIAESLGVPCYPVIGNHDIYFNNWPSWRDLIGSTRYRIDGDTTSLFILDSANAFFGRSQLDWLESEIKTVPENNRIFVFTHANLFINSFPGIQQNSDSRERARLISILNGRCDFMFTGHSHKHLQTEAGSLGILSLLDFKKTQSYYRVLVTKEDISYLIEEL